MTLTQTAVWTKRVLLSIAILSVIGLSTWLSLRFYYVHYFLPQKRAEEEKPQVKFGILPKPLFPTSTLSSSNYSYSIDTDTGALPTDLPKTLKVYFNPQLGTSLLAANKARELASSLNFTTGPDLINPTSYKFSDASDGSLTIDINSGNFSFKRKPKLDPQELKQESLEDEDTLDEKFKDFLNRNQLLKSGLRKGKMKVIYEKFSRKESTTAAVTIWPEDIDKIPVVTPSSDEGLIKGILSKERGENPFFEFKFIYWLPDTQNFSTYPIKDTQTALADLKGGKAIILKEPKLSKVSISSIFLAYFEPFEYVQYIQPVFVFQGNDFLAYVSAITDQYLEK